MAKVLSIAKSNGTLSGRLPLEQVWLADDSAGGGQIVPLYTGYSHMQSTLFSRRVTNPSLPISCAVFQ